MEQNKENKKFEELSDEQLKKVAGGKHKPACPGPPLYCLWTNDNCECMECEAGYTLIDGSCV